MNLVPQHILDTRKRQLFRILTWAAAGLLVLLCAAAAAVVRFQAAQLDQEAAQSEANLQIRQRLLQESDQVARARLPLLRLRTAEALQRNRTGSLGRLAEALFDAPKGVTLDSVEVREAADPSRFEFVVSGTALSEGPLSTAPLARYLGRVQSLPGAMISPLETVQVEDLAAEGAPPDRPPAQRAAARFTLRGTVP